MFKVTFRQRKRRAKSANVSRSDRVRANRATILKKLKKLRKLLRKRLRKRFKKKNIDFDYDENLTEETKNALVEERERKKRIQDKRKLEREALAMMGAEGVVEDVFLDIESKTKEPIQAVDKSIVNKLKGHQIEGVKFLWDSCFETVDLIKEGHKGSGCILAHSMGLGKTLTTIT